MYTLYTRSYTLSPLIHVLIHVSVGTTLVYNQHLGLRRGDRFERSDAAFELADGIVILFEWDGVFHTADPARIAQDVRKLKRMLATDPRAIILRARADGAPPLDEVVNAEIVEQAADRARIVLVNLDVARESRNPGWSLRAIAQALAPKLRELGGALVPRKTSTCSASWPSVSAPTRAPAIRQSMRETWYMRHTSGPTRRTRAH